MDDPLALAERHATVREDVLRRVVARDETVESPYRQFGTLVAKERTLFPFLAGVARDRSCTNHGAVARECGIHPARLGSLLAILGRHEAELGRPLLPAVVTKADRKVPGDEFFDLVERVPNQPDDVPAEPAQRRWLWETERAAVYRVWVDDRSRKRARRTVTVP